MADSDGNFHISLCNIYGNKNLKRGRVICSFTLSQRMIDTASNLSCIPFMTKAANLFQSNINYKSGNTMAFVAQANNKHYLVKSYFERFPLMSSKHLEYLCFLKGLNYLGKKLTKEEIIEIQTIKYSMNNRRIYFN